ncbi:hypothetical protein CBS101457_003043 [Exobasidium rhododendri]|nr:hypothetical protein CBS101457_003043 [Exobasidium rhododendri]
MSASASSYMVPTSLEGRVLTVVGAGTLGRRIALMWLTQGETVHLFDSDAKQTQSAKEYIDGTLPSVIRDVVHTGAAGTLKLFTNRQEALRSSWIVIECVPEVLDLKTTLLGELDAVLPSDVILATNSSSYTPTEIGSNVRQQDRLVAMHFYTPPQLLPVEIMATKDTNPDIVPLLMKETARHGLKPFHVRKESVGLMANRIWAAVKRECLLTAAEGVAEPAEIDEILSLAFGMVRPFQLMDHVGLDVVRDIEKHYQSVRPGQCPPEALQYLDRYISQGKLGEKSGEGFYQHPKEVPHAKDHLVFLDMLTGEVQSITIDGQEIKTLVSGLHNMPDGVQFDSRPGKGHIYWTAMGNVFDKNDGSVWRADVDGSNVTSIVPSGGTHTPKQIVLDAEGGKLYWCDREGGKIMRCNLDGSQLDTLYNSAPGESRPLTDRQHWCVGITLDKSRGLLYWTQKGSSKSNTGRIFRANVEIPEGQSAEKRQDIETLFDHLPEPIDLEIDTQSQTLYWTDRGDPPFGNSLNKADVSSKHNTESEPRGPSADLTMSDHFHETIGLALDIEKGVAYVSDLLGSIWSCDLKTGDKKAIVRDRGNYTGIALVKYKAS